MLTKQTHASGASTFTADVVGGPVPGSPYRSGRSQLVVETDGPAGRPVRLAYRFAPDRAEFMFKLPMLARVGQATLDVDAMAAAAQHAQPAVTFDASPELVAGLPGGLDDLGAFMDAMAGPLPPFAAGQFRLRKIAFSADPAREG